MTIHVGRVLGLLAGLFTAAACSGTSPGELRCVRGPAILASYGEVADVRVPNTAQVGTPFVVTITSFAGGCITGAGTSVTVEGLTVEVRPLREEVVEGACPSVLSREQHTATMQFDRSGEGRIRIIGLARPAEEPYIVEHQVAVVP